MNPHIIKLHIEGHNEKIKEIDRLAWMFNQYTLSAVRVAVEYCLAGKKANAKYIDKPLLSDEMLNEEMTEENKQKEVEKFFAQEKARRVNWKRNHNKDSSVS